MEWLYFVVETTDPEEHRIYDGWQEDQKAQLQAAKLNRKFDPRRNNRRYKGNKRTFEVQPCG